MVDTLGVRELRAVLAHELGHLHAGDTFIFCMASVTDGLVRLVASLLSLAAMVALWGLRVAAGLLGAPGLATRAGSLLQRSIGLAWLLCDRVVALVAAGLSRQAELEADRLGAQLAGRQAMLTALCRIEGLNAQVEPAGWLARMYATHPPVHDRIEALREVAA
jgi:heat shock protein HtpX